MGFEDRNEGLQTNGQCDGIHRTMANVHQGWSHRVAQWNCRTTHTREIYRQDYGQIKSTDMTTIYGVDKPDVETSQASVAYFPDLDNGPCFHVPFVQESLPRRRLLLSGT